MKSIAVVLLLGLIVCGGCAGARAPAKSDLDPKGFPFVLQGDDTFIQLDFSNAVSDSNARQQLFSGEVCRLVIGNCTIECFVEGSVLLLGPGDGIRLVDGNPIWTLRAAGADSQNSQLLRLYATFFLIAGSVEQIPQGLVNYLDNPGDRRGVAIRLIRQLLAEGGAHATGIAPGGKFQVTFQLTQSGRNKLRDAMNLIDEDSGSRLVNVEFKQ